MAVRKFFKAHLSGRTYFRGTKTGKTFLSARGLIAGIAWSAKSAAGANAIEITEAEFNALKALHAARIIALGKLPGHYSSPNYAWVEGEL